VNDELIGTRLSSRIMAAPVAAYAGQGPRGYVSTRCKPARTVIVDDSRTFLQTICSFFEDEPLIEVIATAENAQDALMLVEKLRPDLVLIDLVMPGMSGLDAVLVLRNKFPLTRVIMMIAHAITPELRKAANKRGAYEFVSKTCLCEQLPLLLAKILETIAIRNSV
jgi:DNA-binding NarL/FixJ family response regulator